MSREQLLLDAIAVRDGEPSIAETAVGDGWASSPAQSSSRALSLCGTRLAVPFRTWEAESARPRSAVALLDWAGQGFERSGEVAVPGVVERLVCVRGRLFAASDSGVWPIDTTGASVPHNPSLSERRRVDLP